MTEIPIDTNQTAQPAANAPLTVGGSSSGALLPDTKLQLRQATGVAMDGFAPQAGDVIENVGANVSDVTSAQQRSKAQPNSFGYIGQNLVDRNGVIVRSQYDASNEAYNELAKMGPSERAGFLNSLAARGLYGTSKPSSTGFDTKDFSAMSEFLRFANSQGVTADVAYSQFLTQFKAGGGGGRAVRTTAKEDIRSVFRDSTRRLLGRDVSNEEIEKFVKSYEGKEITEGTGGVKAPTVANAAEAQVLQQFGEEEMGVGMSSILDVLDQSIKGLA
jgi:hypothetical protein